MTSEPPTRYQPPSHAFPNTCWQLVDDASGKGGKQVDIDSLRTFCLSYWYPLYAWARQSGLKAEDAEDLIQSFFERLIESDFLSAADEAKGKLRSFLIICLKRHARDTKQRDYAAKRDIRKTVSLDFEWAAGQFANHSDPSASPDAMYDRRWAHALLHYALGRLKDTMKEEGKADMFRELRPYLEFRNDEDESYEELAARLGISEIALKSRVHQMRKKYRIILLDLVSMTLQDGEDPKHELIALLNAV